MHYYYANTKYTLITVTIHFLRMYVSMYVCQSYIYAYVLCMHVYMYTEMYYVCMHACMHIMYRCIDDACLYVFMDVYA